VIFQRFALPTGRLGSVIGAYMARGDARLVHRVVHALELAGHESVLDVGYRPGMGLLRLTERLPRGRVYGIDPSPVTRAQAAARGRLTKKANPQIDHASIPASVRAYSQRSYQARRRRRASSWWVRSWSPWPSRG
jgi:SAM-dependent methyltransferase